MCSFIQLVTAEQVNPTLICIKYKLAILTASIVPAIGRVETTQPRCVIRGSVLRAEFRSTALDGAVNAARVRPNTDKQEIPMSLETVLNRIDEDLQTWIHELCAHRHRHEATNRTADDRED